MVSDSFLLFSSSISKNDSAVVALVAGGGGGDGDVTIVSISVSLKFFNYRLIFFWIFFLI